jgi:hypothetical protein
MASAAKYSCNDMWENSNSSPLCTINPVCDSSSRATIARLSRELLK